MPFGARSVGHLADARLVGPDAAPMASVVASTQTQSPPSTVPGRLDAAEDGHAHAAIGLLVQAGLGTPQRLAHGEDDGAVVGRQRRIVREDGIGKPVILVGQPFDLRARSRDEVGEGLMLAARREPGRSPARSAIRQASHGAWRLSPSASARAATALPWTARRIAAADGCSSPFPPDGSETVNKHAAWTPARAREGGLTAASRPVHPD